MRDFPHKSQSSRFRYRDKVDGSFHLPHDVQSQLLLEGRRHYLRIAHTQATKDEGGAWGGWKGEIDEGGPSTSTRTQYKYVALGRARKARLPQKKQRRASASLEGRLSASEHDVRGFDSRHYRLFRGVRRARRFLISQISQR